MSIMCSRVHWNRSRRHGCFIFRRYRIKRDDHLPQNVLFYQFLSSAMSFDFSPCTIPEFISEPIKHISVVAQEIDAEREFTLSLFNSRLYKSTNIIDVVEFIDSVLAHRSKTYSLTITRDQNKITLDSRVSTAIQVTLDEHTYNHHSYAGRYIRFTKSKPAKGSKEFVTYYTADTKWNKKEKYFKDLSAVVSEVFTGADMTLAMESENPFTSTVPMSNIHQGVKPRATPLFVPPELRVTERSSVIDPENPQLTPEEQLEIYEFLCLVHLNSLPDFTNSHARATSLYEYPQTALDLQLPLASVSVLATQDVNPKVYLSLAKSRRVLSVQATTATASYLTLNLGKATWTWVLRR